jgi:ribosomal protein L17
MDEEVDEAVLELRANKAGAVTARSIRSIRRCRWSTRITTSWSSRRTATCGWSCTSTRAVASCWPSSIRFRGECRRTWCASTRSTTRCDPGQLRGRGDARGPAHRLRPAGAGGGDQRRHRGARRGAVRRAARDRALQLPGGRRPEWSEDRAWGERRRRVRLRSPCGRWRPVPARIQDVLNRPIEDLAELSVRSRNSCRRRTSRPSATSCSAPRSRCWHRQLREEVAAGDQRVPGRARTALRRRWRRARTARCGGWCVRKTPRTTRTRAGTPRAAPHIEEQEKCGIARRGAQLGRTSEHKEALLRNMATSLFRHGRIETTTAKAKELRPYAEKLITLARRGDLHAKRLAARKIQDRDVLCACSTRSGRLRRSGRAGTRAS